MKEQEKLEKILQRERESTQQEESEKQTTEVSLSEDSLPSEESKTVVENTSVTTSSQIQQETVLAKQVQQGATKMAEQEGIQRMESADRELEGATLATDDSDWNKFPESLQTAPVEHTLEHQLTSQSTFQGRVYIKQIAYFFSFKMKLIT